MNNSSKNLNDTKKGRETRKIISEYKKMINQLQETQADLDRGKYQRAYECVRDVRLIWRAFVIDKTISLHVQSLEKNFERCVRIICCSTPKNIHKILFCRKASETVQSSSSSAFQEEIGRKKRSPLHRVADLVHSQIFPERDSPPVADLIPQKKPRLQHNLISDQALSHKPCEVSIDSAGEDDTFYCSEIDWDLYSIGTDIDSNEGSLLALPQKAFRSYQNGESVVIEGDSLCSSDYSFLLMSQYKVCYFEQRDKKYKRLNYDLNYAGLACKYCANQHHSLKGRFFHSSYSTLTKNIKPLHGHVVNCEFVPQDLSHQLIKIGKDIKKIKSEFKHSVLYKKVWERVRDKSKVVLSKSKSDIRNEEKEVLTKEFSTKQAVSVTPQFFKEKTSPAFSYEMDDSLQHVDTCIDIDSEENEWTESLGSITLSRKTENALVSVVFEGLDYKWSRSCPKIAFKGN